VVITLFVLLIDASLKSRSTGAIQQISVGAWVDRVLPVITSSNAEGQELAAVWANGLGTPPSADATQVSEVARGAVENYAAAAKLAPPVGLGGAAGLLDAALLSREKAATYIETAFTQTLGSAAVEPGTRTTASAPPAPVAPASVVPGLTNAASDLQLGDQAYQLFQQSLPASVGVKFPASAWAGNLGPYGAQAAQLFLATLQSKAVPTPVYKASIFGITTDPAPVSTGTNGQQTLPDAQAITLDVVLADTGNQPENNLTVTAAISPARNGASSVRDFVDLGVGQAYTITGFGPLDPPLGVAVTLTVTVSGGSGSQLTPVTQTLTFQMPAPPPPSTTTTTAPSTTTTTG
jgi:hypothetical protein